MYDTGIDKAEYNAYVAGAEEQRKIDVDKACSWLERCGKTYVVDITDDNRITIDTKCLLYNFRKAMEKEL